jgi:hypothetical protein
MCRFAAFSFVGSANSGQRCGIAQRLLTRSQRSSHELPGWLHVSLLAAVVVLAGWQAPAAQADDEPATTAVAEVATGVTEGAAPGLAPPGAITDTDEVASGGEAPSEAGPDSGPGQKLAKPTSPSVARRSPAGATPAPDPERRRHRPPAEAEPRGQHRAPADTEPRHDRPTPDAESRQDRPTPDAEPPQARPALEATKEHPAGAADVTTAHSPAIAQPTAPSGAEPEPTGPPNLRPPGRTAQVDVPDDEPAPARPSRARTRTAQAPSLPASHAPAALLRHAHESAPGAAHPSAPPRSVRKRAPGRDHSVTRARGYENGPAREAPHRRGVPGAASAAAAAANGSASPSNAVLSGAPHLAPAGFVRPLPVSRPVRRPMNVAEPRERPG